jgi:hypothetical protein
LRKLRSRPYFWYADQIEKFRDPVEEKFKYLWNVTFRSNEKQF